MVKWPIARFQVFVTLGLVSLLSACGLLGGDHSNVAELQRSRTATHAVTGSIDSAGILTIATQESFDPDGMLLDSGTQAVDLFDYEPETGRTYAFLVKVSSGNGEILGDAGDILLSYVHDLVTDEPAEGHPGTRTESGKTATDLLDCLRDADSESNTRFEALAATVAEGSDELWDCS